MFKKRSEELKICISATGNNLDAFLDPRFGRAMFFLIVDSNGKLIKAIKNTGEQAMRGAGVTAAQIVADEKVDILITGNIGPNASIVLGTSKIKVFIGIPETPIIDVIKKYQENKLQEAVDVKFSQSGPGLGRGGRGGMDQNQKFN
jgi:predicted Fe-Mo cluster-binding NifX family protein